MAFIAWLKTNIILEIWSREVPTVRLYFGICRRENLFFNWMLMKSLSGVSLSPIIMPWVQTLFSRALVMTRKSTSGHLTSLRSRPQSSSRRKLPVTTRQGLLMWARPNWWALTTATLMIYLQLLEEWFQFGTTRDHRQFRPLNGASTPWQRSSLTRAR